MSDIRVSINTQVTDILRTKREECVHEWLCWCTLLFKATRQSSCCEHTCRWRAPCVAPLCTSSELWDHGYVVPVPPGLQVWLAPTSPAPRPHLSQSQQELTHLTETGQSVKRLQVKTDDRNLKFKSKLCLFPLLNSHGIRLCISGILLCLWLFPLLTDYLYPFFQL